MMCAHAQMRPPGAGRCYMRPRLARGVTSSYNTKGQPLYGVHQMVIEVAGMILRRPQLLWLCSALSIAPDKLESVKPFHPIRSESLKTEYKQSLLSWYSDKCSM